MLFSFSIAYSCFSCSLFLYSVHWSLAELLSLSCPALLIYTCWTCSEYFFSAHSIQIHSLSILLLKKYHPKRALKKRKSHTLPFCDGSATWFDLLTWTKLVGVQIFVKCLSRKVSKNYGKFVSCFVHPDKNFLDFFTLSFLLLLEKNSFNISSVCFLFVSFFIAYKKHKRT